MILKIDFSYILNRTQSAGIWVDEDRVKEVKRDLEEMNVLDFIKKWNAFKINEDEEVEDGEIIRMEDKEWYALLTVDGDTYEWELEAVSRDSSKILELYKKKLKESKTMIEHEYKYSHGNGCIFEDGSEIWMLKGLGKDVKGDFAYVVFCEDSEGFGLEYVTNDDFEAHDMLNGIIESYIADGFNIYRRYDDMVVFNNDDVFKVRKIKILK